MFCKNCGSKNEDGAKFCKSCGAKLEADMSTDDNQVTDGTPSKRGKQRALSLPLALIALAVVLAGAFLLLRNLIDNKGELSNSAQDATHISDKLYYSIPDAEHITEDATTKVTFVDNEVIVYLADGYTQTDAESLSEQYDGRIVGMSAYVNSYQLRFDKARSYDELNQLIEELEADPRIEAVSKNVALKISPDERTDDPVWSGAPKQYWGLTAINAPEAWDIVQAGPDVHVGIMDSQFYLEHEDLSGAFAATMPSYETSFNAKDASGAGRHGTHVAGIIGARANNVGTVGVAPGVTMYGYSAIDGIKDRSGKEMITLSYGLEVGWIYLIVENGCRVVNMSLCEEEQQLKNSINSESVIPEERSQLVEASSSCENSIRALIRAGYDDFVICKSAGNSGEEGGLADYDFLGYIAAEDVRSRIIIVGSVSGSDGRLLLSRFSCGGHRVDIVAPGEDIYSTYYDSSSSLFGKVTVKDTYAYLSGTSMATPMVAGTAALVIVANPNLKGDQIKQVICETAAKGSYAVDHEYFVGLLDAEAAVKRAASGTNGLSTSDEAYAAYAEKLEEYIAKYGSPQVVSAGSTWSVSGDGVCLAELIDFDADGLEELYVAYYDRDKENHEYAWTGHDANAYVIEVWSFIDGKVQVAYQGGGTFTNQQGLASCGLVILDSSESDGREAPIYWVQSSGYENDRYIAALWSIDGGSSQLEHKWEMTGEFTNNMKWLADGVETELNESEWRDTFDAEWRDYRLMDFSENEHVSDCIDLTRETMHRLGISG